MKEDSSNRIEILKETHWNKEHPKSNKSLSKSLSNGISQRENRVSEPEDKVEEQEQFNKNKDNKLLGEF